MFLLYLCWNKYSHGKAKEMFEIKIIIFSSSEIFRLAWDYITEVFMKKYLYIKLCSVSMGSSHYCEIFNDECWDWLFRNLEVL